MSCQI